MKYEGKGGKQRREKGKKDRISGHFRITISRDLVFSNHRTYLPITDLRFRRFVFVPLATWCEAIISLRIDPPPTQFADSKDDAQSCCYFFFSPFPILSPFSFAFFPLLLDITSAQDNRSSPGAKPWAPAIQRERPCAGSSRSLRRRPNRPVSAERRGTARRKGLEYYVRSANSAKSCRGSRATKAERASITASVIVSPAGSSLGQLVVELSHRVAPVGQGVSLPRQKVDLRHAQRPTVTAMDDSCRLP